MQRSITNKKNIKNLFFYILFFIIYESLSSIYLFLPPLFGVLFVLLIKALDNDDAISVLLIAFCLVIFEADKGYILFSSVIFLLLSYKFILPRLVHNVNCQACMKFLYILVAYLGFYLFNLLFAYIFFIPIPNFTYYILYYIVMEFFIVSLL